MPFKKKHFWLSKKLQRCTSEKNKKGYIINKKIISKKLQNTV